MASLALSRQYKMREMTCGNCGIVFWAPEFFMYEREKTKKNWYCPNGHCRIFSESEGDRLRRELEQEKQRTAMERQLRIDTEARLLRETKAHKRTVKRINAGVCPHCHRTFQQLARHMECKHGEILKGQTK